MEAAHVANEEDLTQNHPQTTVPAATNLVTPTASSEPAPSVVTRPPAPTPKRRGRPSFVRDNLVPPRRRGSTTRRGLAATTIPLTPTQNAAAAPPPPAQPRVVRPDVGSRSQIPASPSNAAVPCSGTGSMPQGPLVRPTLQAQPTAPFRPPTVTRDTMAAASPTTQSMFTCFIPPHL
ncbi:lysine-rich arabinogalactan protein 19-like [Arachis ipaensis]|uniref:lysine-rich arabinogalactan protein 19-like n=1 Tax=Arachis ipaensis TaxID=130454 RepID=UPI0007AF69FF|nr:lysine-rich arabinogalactan protein 19-like [Arachis ipaensis]XP_025652177.1 lysine-rich arabinogalactan protein 19-like [Arachis hypogaea]